MNGRSVFVAVIAVALASLAACGTDGEPAGTAGAAAVDEEGPLVVRAGDTFTVDSFDDAGFKKSKEFSTETVPESTAIWYGFYGRQDVEIRFYDSHAVALGPGIESAQAAVDRSPNANLQGNALFASGQRTQYGDFMVARNAVILCQSDISVCADLVSNIP